MYNTLTNTTHNVWQRAELSSIISYLGEDVAPELFLVGDERVAVESEERLLLPHVDIVPLVQLIVTLLLYHSFHGGGGTHNHFCHHQTNKRYAFKGSHI